MRALLVVLLFALAGCQEPGPEPALRFDGAGAYAFVEALVTEDGEPRYRAPGTPGHTSAAEWLEATMAMPGWSVTRQSFTGAEYQQHDPGAVGVYNRCTQEDRDELPGFTFHNLYATQGSGDMIWFGAHWDSKEDSHGGPMVGANDGASGVGVLLRLMQHISDGELVLDHGIGIIFFDGEDGFEDCHPLAGSIHFARTMPEGLVDRFVLLDMVGDLDAKFVLEGHSAGSDPAMQALLWEHGKRIWPTAFTDRQRSVFDDHIPFIEEGVPSVDIIDYGRSPGGFPPYWHTSGDDMTNISPVALGRIGQVLIDSLRDPDFSPVA